MTPRSIRNNNPGNIRVGDNWRGLAKFDQMTDAQKRETAFCVFSHPKWGFRAMAIVLMNYQERHNLLTIRGMIDRWAPPHENNTEGYIGRVCADLDVGPDENVDVQEYRVMRALVEAIALVESGGKFPWKDKVVDAGLKLAGIVKPQKSAAQDPAVLTTAGISAAGVAGAATEVAETVEQARPFIDSVSDVLPALGGFLALAVAGFALWKFVLKRRDEDDAPQGSGEVLPAKPEEVYAGIEK